MAGEAIGASSIIGLAQEVTAGTYVAPTKFFPVVGSSLDRNQNNHKRRVIRGTADQIGQTEGNAIVEGQIEMECLHDVLPYFMYAGRFTVVKTGAGPYVYTCTPNDTASVANGDTLSITQVRNGQTFGYTGVVVTSFEIYLDEFILMLRLNVIGEEEASQSLPTATWPTSVPYGAGDYTVEFDDSAADDVDGWSFNIDNAGEAMYRVEGSAGASFIKYGERTTTVKLARDFKTRTDFDAYKVLTAQKIDMTATNGTDIIYLEVPVAIKQSYGIPISGQGDLIQAQIEYDGVYDATVGASAQVIITTDENIT